MPEPTLTMAALVAGGCACIAVAAIGYRGTGLNLSLPRRRETLISAFHVAAALRRLSDSLDRAGWRESPERVITFGAAAATCVAVLFGTAASALSATSAAALALVGFLGACGTCVLVLSSAIERRQRRLSGELVPILELFTLELSGGGSALSALGSVTVQIDCELATDLRRMLIASQVAGSPSFESRLLEHSDHLEIPALGSLATILAASREYGTGTSQGVRALATDLRRTQRRELIAHSRHALNNVLLPAAVGVLLPFLGVLMFPAVSVLQRSLR